MPADTATIFESDIDSMQRSKDPLVNLSLGITVINPLAVLLCIYEMYV